MATVNGPYGSIDEFLNLCSQSGDSAYTALRSLLERLENPNTRTEARVFLSHLQKKLDTDGDGESSQHCLDTYHFQIQDIYLDRSEDTGYQNRKKLTMMVIPSIFMPEDWSFTFYEGLNRHPDSIFKDKTVAELGCGNGWISIAIAEKWLPSKVYGLDINPRAVKISWINLYLNAFDENGQPVYDSENKTLLDRVEFYESDLLSYCRDNHIELERIVGCIPQENFNIVGYKREIGSRLFIDISDQFELSSLPNSIGVLKYLARTPLPSHAAIICGLLRNQVYIDLEVAFVISEEQTIFDALTRSVELLQGNTALISQYYYGCLFHELLSFQLPDRRQPAEREAEDVEASDIDMIGFSSSAISVLSQAELSVRVTEKYSLLHMDVDQIFLPTPTPVKAAIFESFARQNVTESECDVTPNLRQFIKNAYNLSVEQSAEFIYADFPLALFNKLVLCCIEEGGSLCMPAGSNGNYVSAAKFLNANIVSIPTQAEVGFKLTEKQLSSVLETVHKPWVYISGPTINPTGLLYSNEEMKSLLAVCAKYGARVIIDTSFSGIEFNSQGWDGWNLDASLAGLTGNPSFSVCLLGRLFFKLPTGGLAYGFLVLKPGFLADSFHSSFSGLNKPHSTIRYTAKKLLELEEQKGDLTGAAQGQEKLLATRMKRLKETLENCGWEVIEAHGGVSVIAKPCAYLGKKIKLEKDGSTWETKLDGTNIREAMLRATGLCINGASWTGIPDYCRFTLALEDGDFDRALDCIVKFQQYVK